MKSLKLLRRQRVVDPPAAPSHTGGYKLLYSKETDNTLRWEFDAGDAKFQLVVAKATFDRYARRDKDGTVLVSRAAYVEIQLEGDFDSEGYEQHDSNLLRAIVDVHKEHNASVEYVQTGKHEWDIGRPFIPKSLLPSPVPCRVGLIIRWSET